MEIYKPSILVVDDDPDILMLVEAILTQANYNVICCDDAMRAMETLENRTFDALLSDANMPVYSGFDLIQTIKKDKQHSTMAVAMLTARREKKYIERALGLGVDDYIVKPIDPAVLLKKIDSLLSKKPPKQQPALKFLTLKTESVAEIRLKTTLVSISELGIFLESNYSFQEGSTLNIHCSLFEEIEIKPGEMRVISSKRKDSTTWMLQLSFVSAGESLRQKIRFWSHKYKMNHKKAG